MINNFPAARRWIFRLLVLSVLFTVSCAPGTPTLVQPVVIPTAPLPSPTSEKPPLLFGIQFSTSEPQGTPAPTATPFWMLPDAAPTQPAAIPVTGIETAVEPQALEPVDSVNALPGSVWGWGLIPTRQGLWAVRGSGIDSLQLTSDPVERLSVSPNGLYAAYITHPDPYNDPVGNPFGYTLKVLHLSSGETHTVAELSSPEIDPRAGAAEKEPAALALYAYGYRGLAWSPGSTYLAFVSPHEGLSADLYIYVTTTGEVRRLSNLHEQLGQPAYAHQLSWSPSGRQIYYAAAYHFGNSNDFLMAGAWVASVSGGETQVSLADSTREEIVSWSSNEEVLLSSRFPGCSRSALRAKNLSSGSERVLWPGCFSAYLYNERTGEFLINMPVDVTNNPDNREPGLWLINLNREGAVQISSVPFDRLYSGDRYAAWYAYDSRQGLLALQRDGSSSLLFSGPPFDGSSGIDLRPSHHRSNQPIWLWSGDGLFAAQQGQEPIRIYDRPINQLISSSTREDTFFFTADEEDGTRLYAFRTGEWVPMLVDERITSAGGIDWTTR